MIMLQLVDESGTTIGHAEKIAAHEAGGLLHRAVSVVLINDQGEILVQRRSATKYHFAGKWANAGCTHPLVHESPIEAGRRALRDELGISCDLVEVLRFVYEAHDPESGYTEREFDHVLFGSWSGSACPNPAEVSEVGWLSAEELVLCLLSDAESFAHWFREILRELVALPSQERACYPRLASFIQVFADAHRNRQDDPPPIDREPRHSVLLSQVSGP